MHETVIANNIIMEVKKYGEIEKLHLEIGELAAVPANELLECLKSAAGWKVIGTEKRARVRCSCGFNGHPTVLERGHDSFLIECPKCKRVPEIIEGQDITIKKVVVK